MWLGLEKGFGGVTRRRRRITCRRWCGADASGRCASGWVRRGLLRGARRSGGRSGDEGRHRGRREAVGCPVLVVQLPRSQLRWWLGRGGVAPGAALVEEAREEGGEPGGSPEGVPALGRRAGQRRSSSALPCRVPRGRQRARAPALRRSSLRSGGCHRAPGRRAAFSLPVVRPPPSGSA